MSLMKRSFGMKFEVFTAAAYLEHSLIRIISPDQVSQSSVLLWTMAVTGFSLDWVSDSPSLTLKRRGYAAQEQHESRTEPPL